ncbi:uncharacterized protein DEA37_0015269 [Paragonimus westermani]|uniref:Uncharacterized protein n=1 Tax=Paragonimus westermani TaxID=34504 RepID=A0A5J4NLC7_9TREM|nr:uncharacterized protein DEA37_0015269 [Paragonimus westermani]
MERASHFQCVVLLQDWDVPIPTSFADSLPEAVAAFTYLVRTISSPAAPSPYGSPSFSPRGNPFPPYAFPRYPHSPINLPFQSPQPVFSPNSPYAHSGYSQPTDSSVYNSPIRSNFYPDPGIRNYSGSFASTPSYVSAQEHFYSNSGTPNRTTQNSTISSAGGSSSRRRFNTSSRDDWIERALADPWADITPTQTPDAGCLVSRPLAQRHTVLFAPRDGNCKSERMWTERDPSELPPKRSSLVNPVDPSDVDLSVP